ncbi:MAG: IS607 family transposase [Desulfovibrio sp.]|nr:IS607 family transposase [Desulfovibrio sp.]
MDRLLKIGEAAKVLGVSISTLRRWQKKGKIVPVLTQGGHRRYDMSKLLSRDCCAAKSKERTTIAYVRAASPDQKADLERQKEILEEYCTKNGWTFEILTDFGSGIDYHKQGLKQLLKAILAERVSRLVITHKDRLLRLGAELIFALCESKNVEVVIVNDDEDTSFEEDVATDVLEIINVFSARLYGIRSRKNQMMLEACKKAVLDNMDEENGES